MVRDMDLVRKILLNVEAGNLHAGVEGFADDAVNFHKALVVSKDWSRARLIIRPEKILRQTFPTSS